MSLLQAVEEACDDIDVSDVQGWIQHSRQFFPPSLVRDDIVCDFDEVLWPGPARQFSFLRFFIETFSSASVYFPFSFLFTVFYKEHIFLFPKL